MFRRPKVRVYLDAQYVADAKEHFATKSATRAVEITMIIALAVCASSSGLSDKYLEEIKTSRYFR